MHYWPRQYADVVDRATCDATISKAFGLCSCGFFDAVRALQKLLPRHSLRMAGVNHFDVVHEL
jgi:hypothetical protein